MKKAYLILSVFVLLVVACSTSTLIPGAAPAPTLSVPTVAPSNTTAPTSLPTETLPALTATSMPTGTSAATSSLTTETPALTFTPASSLMPTQLTSAFTGTPIYLSTATMTGTSAPSATIQPTFTFTPQATATNTAIPPTPQGPVFQSITTSTSQLNWGDTCDNNSITFTAQTANGFNVTGVLLFTRLQSRNGSVTTYWNKAISMHNDGLGTFTYDLTPTVINYYQQFNAAWIQYQLVATNFDLQTVGRTQVYGNNLVMVHCQ